MSTGSGVTVIAEEVVGPYETVQLQSSDPTALQDWLDAHGYVVPADVQGVVTQYVNEGFDFLAMRLVPGQGTSAMRPVRITSPGAGLTLPLRMVAVGTGAITPIIPSCWRPCKLCNRAGFTSCMATHASLRRNCVRSATMRVRWARWISWNWAIKP